MAATDQRNVVHGSNRPKERCSWQQQTKGTLFMAATDMAAAATAEIGWSKMVQQNVMWYRAHGESRKGRRPPYKEPSTRVTLHLLLLQCRVVKLSVQCSQGKQAGGLLRMPQLPRTHVKFMTRRECMSCSRVRELQVTVVQMKEAQTAARIGCAESCTVTY